MAEEVWKDVPGYPGVQASSWGRVICREGGKPTFGSISKASKTGEYLRMRTRIKVDGKRKTVKIHILVNLAFNGLPPKGKKLTLHKDDNGLNNMPTNLRWGSHDDNMDTPRIRALLSEKALAMERKNGKFAARTDDETIPF